MKCAPLRDRFDGDKRVIIWCPGCQAADKDPCHALNVTSVHKFNGDYDSPTFEPSLMAAGSVGGYVCHSYVRDGQIQFLGDCTHPLANQTVPLLDIPEDNEWVQGVIGRV